MIYLLLFGFAVWLDIKLDTYMAFKVLAFPVVAFIVFIIGTGFANVESTTITSEPFVTSNIAKGNILTQDQDFTYTTENGVKTISTDKINKVTKGQENKVNEITNHFSLKDKIIFFNFSYTYYEIEME